MCNAHSFQTVKMLLVISSDYLKIKENKHYTYLYIHTASGENILATRRKTGFNGFIISMISVPNMVSD